MKLLLLIPCLLPLSIEAKPKYGLLRVKTSPAMEISIAQEKIKGDVIERELRPGSYQVQVLLPSGEYVSRSVLLSAGCQTEIEVKYTPPATVIQDVIKEVVREVPKIERVTEPCPVAPTKFDECCDCKADAVKARLDLFAIELKRDPRTQAKVYGPEWIVDYLIGRGVERTRIEFVKAECVSLWLQ